MEEKKTEGKKPDTKNTGQQKAATKAKNTFNGKNYERLYPFVKMGGPWGYKFYYIKKNYASFKPSWNCKRYYNGFCAINE